MTESVDSREQKSEEYIDLARKTSDAISSYCEEDDISFYTIIDTEGYKVDVAYGEGYGASFLITYLNENEDEKILYKIEGGNVKKEGS
jgi:hypothetical protein